MDEVTSQQNEQTRTEYFAAQLLKLLSTKESVTGHCLHRFLRSHHATPPVLLLPSDAEVAVIFPHSCL